MGQTTSQQAVSSALTATLSSSFTMQGVAGQNAIAQNDLLLVNSAGKVYSANNADNLAVSVAGAAVIAQTTVASYLLNTFSRKEIFVSPIDGGIYVTSASGASNTGLNLAKFTSAGALVRSLTIDSTAATLNCPCVQQLSNGNILVTWQLSNNTLNFAIYDQFLNVVVAKTQVSAAVSQVWYDAVPLSGGGFALAYPLATGIFFATYTNAGGVVYAPTLIAGTPTAGGAVRIVQLSNSNIALAINSSTAAQALGHCIFSVAGAQILAYTVLNAATSVGSVHPEIQMVAGFYACSLCDGANMKCFVLNNAGAIQGAAYSAADTAVDGGINKWSKLLNDGSAFWLAHVLKIVYVPTSGTGYVINTAGASPNDAILDKGNILIFGSSATGFLHQIIGGGQVQQLPNITLPGTGLSCTIKAAGDFCVAHYTTYAGPATAFTMMKYQSASVVGVAQGAVPSNNPGTPVPYSAGPGGFACNPITGTISKAFDHSAAALIGNKGTVVGSISATLKGF